MSYLVPDADIVEIVDAPPTPAAVLSPDRRWLLLVHYESHPPIALLARPFLALAGVRVDPARRSRQRTLRLVGLSVIEVGTGEERRVSLPEGVTVGLPVWSPDSSQVVFMADGADRVEAWRMVVAPADGMSMVAAPVRGVAVGDVLTGGQLGGEGPLRWSRDSRSVYVLAVPADRAGQPLVSAAPPQPRVEETFGKRSMMATFQDLLSSPGDADLFEDVGSTQLVRVDVATGAVTPLGEPGLVWDFAESPDGRYLFVVAGERPFSFRVPFRYFTRRLTVIDATTGAAVGVVGPLPVADEVARHGVPTGPRQFVWDEASAARLLWIEALDGGDPTVPADHRDQVMRLDAPFTDEPVEAFRTAQRCLGWYDGRDSLIVVEHDRDRRWRTTSLVDVDRPDERRVLFDCSMDDAYADPGTPLVETLPDGRSVVVQRGSSIYLRGAGATPEGNRPFLDRLDLDSGEVVRVHASPAGAIEPVVGLVADDSAVIARRESPTEPPNFVVVPLDGGPRRPLTSFRDPHPHLTGLTKRIRRHRRDDGVELSGVLYLPPGHDVERQGRLPLVIWAYPLDYGDGGTAGQVRTSDLNFTRLTGMDPIWFVLRGYAVLMDATMPVVGDPETMNDTYIEQVNAAARAHIDALDEDQIVDPARVIVAGHSYGGFMTANLLAHTDLFAAGIARSGAYNRSLTPFGFQTERRAFWEAPQVYDAVSPFRFADHITAPLLLVHGGADNNPGTFTIQSERLFQAIEGTGGTARLVILPHEAHGYAARESILHLLAEQFAWAQRWAPATTTADSQ